MISGGFETNPNEYPWVAGLFRGSKLYCGATVLSNNYLLTAAHCVSSFEPNEIRVSAISLNGIKDEVTSIHIFKGIPWWSQYY